MALADRRRDTEGGWKEGGGVSWGGIFRDMARLAARV